MHGLFGGLLAIVLLILNAGHLSAQTPLQSQPDVCRGDASLQGTPIRKLTIEARGGWQPSVHLPFGPGDAFDFAQLTNAQTIVSQALSNDPLRDSVELQAQNSLSVTFVASCVTVVEGAACGQDRAAGGSNQCVDIVIRPFSVRLGLSNTGANAVPVARSNRATAYSQVPVLLRALNPAFGVEHDRRVGFSETLRVSTDLFTLSSMFAGKVPDDNHTSLNLDLRGSKSLNEPFYETNADLALDRRHIGKRVEAFSLLGGFSANSQPLADGQHNNNSARVGGSARFRSAKRTLDTLMLAGNYRWTDHRFVESRLAEDESTAENAFEGRALLDGRAGDGTWRLASWFETNQPSASGFNPYRRFAFLGGYQSELGKTEQTIGLELLAGAGWSWGTTPAYARFYGGTGLGNFLHEAHDAPIMRSLPTGPLLRSLGRGEGTAEDVNGPVHSDAYWHVNLNVTVPIPRFSCPLIPPLALFDNVAAQNAATNPCQVRRPPPGVKTLKDTINGMVVSGENFLSADIAEDLIEHGMEAEVAEKEGAERAANVFRQIRPAMRFITEKANLYAIKPLFMLDVGRIATEGSEDPLTRVSVGGGLQLLIATAKFEVGYMVLGPTISRRS